MLDYIEIIWSGGSICFDTYCPDGTVESVVHYSMSNILDIINDAIIKNKSNLIAINIICHEKEHYD